MKERDFEKLCDGVKEAGAYRRGDAAAAPLTTSLKDTIHKRFASDPEFASALLKEAVQALLDGETNVGKSLLYKCIDATIGFGPLAETTGIPDKSLQRMFSASGNPQTTDLFAVISALLEYNNTSLEVTAINCAAW